VPCHVFTTVRQSTTLLLRRPLFEEEIEISEAAKALWEAPFAVLAHDTSNPEPLFVYGNSTALSLFQTSWEELVGTPSSRSADPEEAIQSDRSAALSSALENGFIDDYEGWRRSFQGTRFKISKATVFNVEAPSGERVGQAAILRAWEYEDGAVGGPAAAAPPQNVEEQQENERKSPLGSVTLEALEEASVAVDAQAAAVRELKEIQGLKNSDARVQEAVALLLEKKGMLENLRKGVA
jgi:hypothetical protein